MDFSDELRLIADLARVVQTLWSFVRKRPDATPSRPARPALPRDKRTRRRLARKRDV